MEVKLLVTSELIDEKVSELRQVFSQVHYHPTGADIPGKVWAEIDVWLTTQQIVPDYVTLDQVPRLRLIQLTSAGANHILGKPLFQDPKATEQIQLCRASGIHAKSIPQYLICQTVNILAANHVTQHIARAERRWAREDEYIGRLAKSPACHIPTGSTIYGKTVGFLGYGRIARETARIFKAMKATVIAANSTGTQTRDDGYIIPGTGDPEGTVPSQFFSTRDPQQVQSFLQSSDILICTLPSTPHTTGFLTKERLGMLPDGAVLLNIGRGDLLDSGDLVSVLESPRGLCGAVLDVTDPEPLPDNHPLYTHPRIIITPHTSWSFVGYWEAAADLMVTNAKRMFLEKEKPYNLVDKEKGY